MNETQSQTSPDLYRSYENHLSRSYPEFLRRMGINFAGLRGEGAVITDAEGKPYIDCTAGYGLLNLGHNHPALIEALKDQLSSLQPFSRPLITEVQVEMSERLTAVVPAGLNNVFLSNSGSESIDGAIKLARLATRKSGIIAAENSFHGYTYGALSVTGIKKFTGFFGPLLPDVSHVPFGDAQTLESAINDETAAVILEPVQHEAGVTVPPENYLREVRDLCTQKGVLLIIDEVKTGFGKTGSLFACDQAGIVPDILVLGKSLGGGMIPAGAILATDEIWTRFSMSFPLSASSYAGNPLACRAVIATLDVFEQDGNLFDCNAKGERLMHRLSELLGRFPKLLTGVSGKGLLIGLKARNPRIAFNISKHLAENGVIVMPAYGQGAELMFEPPLVITEQQITDVVNAVADACHVLDS